MDTGVTLSVLEGHLAGVLGVAVRTPTEPGAAAQVFSASNDGTVRRWDVAPLPYQRLLDVPFDAQAASAPDGRQVAVGFADGSLCLCPLPGGAPCGEVEDAHGAVLASASRDRTAGSCGGWQGMASWHWQVDVPTGLTRLRSHGVAFSPDGKTLGHRQL